MTRLSKFSTRELQAEVARRRKVKNEREWKKIAAAHKCPECGADPVEISTDAIEEHRMAPRDPDTGEPWLWAPYEMGTTAGLTYEKVVICANGHRWSDLFTKTFDKPHTGPPILGPRR